MIEGLVLIKIQFNAYLQIFFSFVKAHSNWFTNHWILIFISYFSVSEGQ